MEMLRLILSQVLVWTVLFLIGSKVNLPNCVNLIVSTKFVRMELSIIFFLVIFPDFRFIEVNGNRYLFKTVI